MSDFVCYLRPKLVNNGDSGLTAGFEQTAQEDPESFAVYKAPVEQLPSNPFLSGFGMMNRGLRCYFQITLKDMAQDLGLKVTVLSEYETVQGVVPRNMELRVKRYWQRKLG